MDELLGDIESGVKKPRGGNFTIEDKFRAFMLVFGWPFGCIVEFGDLGLCWSVVLYVLLISRLLLCSWLGYHKWCWPYASYPIDTVRRRMMMTSGEAVKYKSSFDAFSQILKNEGPKSLFKGAGANILRAIAGAGVLAGYDKLQVLVLGKKYGSGGA
ncbi:hypothetical protein FH972_000124 [Carpinus fangiana]|uniref:ADP/ATP translocase n=1 Tax=Carpinus fangiana TaxID=176857 RepID=A0A5N6QAP8_9ROSI|nr:hypothetical protein FH972_000124 [Carpinus fangiana]